MSTFTFFDSTDFKEVDDISDIKTFYRLLYNLNQTTLLMSQAKSLDDLYRVTIVSSLELLDIDRIGILLIDDLQKQIIGTWGTDKQGKVHSEHHQSTPVNQGFSDIIDLINTQGKVCIWQDKALYEFNEHNNSSEQVGEGWNGAIGLWESGQLIGWLSCDNLIKHRPFKPYISHILRLLGSVLSEYRLRFLAQEKIENLNKTLELKVQLRTRELVETQQKLQLANQNLELKIQQRTNSLKEKNNELANTIKQLKSTKTALHHAQANVAINDLVLGVAHEINTPLGCAITASSHFPYILGEIEKAASQNKIQQLPAFIQQAQEAGQLLQQNLESTASLISEFKRLSTLDVESVPDQQVNIAQWLDDILLKICTYEIEIKKLHIDTNIHTDILEIVIQSEIFVQIFQELLLNVSLHNKGKECNKVTIKIEIHAQQLFIFVEDNGQGVTKEMQKRIFTPFVTTLRAAGRKGLGLNIAFNLVHFLLKGNLTYFDSKLGGAGFLISCPITLPT